MKNPFGLDRREREELHALLLISCLVQLAGFLAGLLVLTLLSFAVAVAFDLPFLRVYLTGIVVYVVLSTIASMLRKS